MSISSPGIVFVSLCVFRFVILPILMVLRKPKAGNRVPPLNRRVIVLITLEYVTLAALALTIARRHRIEVFGSSQNEPETVMAACGFLAVTLICDRMWWHHTPAERKLRILQIMPRCRREIGPWAIFMGVFATSEEIIFRAVLLGIFIRITDDYWIAAGISAGMFALSHLVSHGLGSVVGLVFVGLGLQWLVKLSNALYVAIAVHFVHNIVNGIIYGVLGKDLPSSNLQEKGTAGNGKAGVATS